MCPASNAGSDDDADAVTPIFKGKLANAQVITHLLKAVNYATNLNVNGDKNGLVVSVDNSSITQTALYITKELFDPYEIKPDRDDPKSDDNTCFCFSIVAKYLVTVLGILGKSGPVALQLRYMGYGSKLEFIVTESFASFETGIKTMTPKDYLLMESDTDLVNHRQVMIRADGFREVTHEMDKSVDRGEEVRLRIDLRKDKTLTFTLSGMSDTHKMTLTSNTQFVEKMVVDEDVSNTYNYDNFKQCYNALSIAQRFQLTMDRDGTLCMNFDIKLDEHMTGGSQAINVFSDFYCRPYEEMF